MRICLYTETALPKLGGQEMVVDALALQFLYAGHDVIVLAPHPRLPLRAKDADLPYQVVRHPRFYSTRFFVSWYQAFLNRLLRQHRSDVLHCHGLYPPGFLAGLGRAGRAIPTVITSHGGDVQANNVRLQKPVLRERIVQGLAAADRLVAISRFTEVRLRYLCPTTPIVTIPNGVDLAPYAEPAARPEGLDESIRPGNYFLFLGRLKERKGVDFLLRAGIAVPSAKLVIAGAGEEKEALEKLAAELGMRDRVVFVGAVYHPAKTYLLQNALASVIPSRISEAFGLVALESFAAGTPVIGTRLPGLADLIKEGQTGWLVPADAQKDLATALTQAWHDRDATKLMGQRGRAFARNFSWSAIATRHLELYQELTHPKMRATAA